jgi:hypothetical protein
MSSKPTALYHFTCRHSKSDIGTFNCLLIPQIRHPLLGCKVTWLTTEASPDRLAMGLTLDRINCDRMEYRYVVTDLTQCRPWIGSPERDAAAPRTVADLESLGDVEHWWIADQPVRARFDRSWQLLLLGSNKQ